MLIIPLSTFHSFIPYTISEQLFISTSNEPSDCEADIWQMPRGSNPLQLAALKFNAPPVYCGVVDLLTMFTLFKKTPFALDNTKLSFVRYAQIYETYLKYMLIQFS